MVRAAAVQLNSTEDKQRNLATADRLTLDGPTVAWARETAAELGVDLVAGSIVERRQGRDKLSNTSVHVGPDGEVKAVYRKIHMFDVEVGGQIYRESDSEEAGDEIVISDLEGL